VLIFSINASRHFQAYGRMVSGISAKSMEWAGEKTFGGLFRIEWLMVKDLPFDKTHHLINPLNENKPVKIGRDGQEVPADVGMALCELMDCQGISSDLTDIFIKRDERRRSKMEKLAKETGSAETATASSPAQRFPKNNRLPIRITTTAAIPREMDQSMINVIESTSSARNESQLIMMALTVIASTLRLA
jgi:hypothetical protein